MHLSRLTCLAMVKVFTRQVLVAWSIAQSRSRFYFCMATIALIIFSITARNMASCNLSRNVYGLESSYLALPSTRFTLIKIWRQIAPLPSLFACLCPLLLRVAWKSLQRVPWIPEPSRHFNLLFTVEGSGIQGMQRVTPLAMHYQNLFLNIARQVAWNIAPCNRAFNTKLSVKTNYQFDCEWVNYCVYTRLGSISSESGKF
jgi:hypothetical protein